MNRQQPLSKSIGRGVVLWILAFALVFARLLPAPFRRLRSRSISFMRKPKKKEKSRFMRRFLPER